MVQGLCWKFDAAHLITPHSRLVSFPAIASLPGGQRPEQAGTPEDIDFAVVLGALMRGETRCHLFGISAERPHAATSPPMKPVAALPISDFCQAGAFRSQEDNQTLHA